MERFPVATGPGINQVNAFVGAVLSLIIGFVTPPLSVTIPATYMKVFYDDAVSTRRTGAEVAYCLVGYEKNGHYRVTAVVKPEQHTYRTMITEPDSLGRPTLWLVSGVVQTPCGKGTIMDLHTHPFADPLPTPSPTDEKTWIKRSKDYPLHGIIEHNNDGKVRISIWGPHNVPIDLRVP